MRIVRIVWRDLVLEKSRAGQSDEAKSISCRQCFHVDVSILSHFAKNFYGFFVAIY